MNKLKASDLRIGNVIMFHDVEDGDMPLAIDWQEIKAVTKDPERFNAYHSPIPLTEEILLKCGFEKNHDGIIHCNIAGVFVFYLPTTQRIVIGSDFAVKKHYLHELQNLIYAKLNEELTINL